MSLHSLKTGPNSANRGAAHRCIGCPLLAAPYGLPPLKGLEFQLYFWGAAALQYF